MALGGRGVVLAFFCFRVFGRVTPPASLPWNSPPGRLYAIELCYLITGRIDHAAGSLEALPEALEPRFWFAFGTKRELFYVI